MPSRNLQSGLFSSSNQTEGNLTYEEWLEAIYNASLHNCHYTCNTCQKNDSSHRYGGCVFCQDGRMINQEGYCACKSDSIQSELESCGTHTFVRLAFECFVSCHKLPPPRTLKPGCTTVPSLYRHPPAPVQRVVFSFFAFLIEPFADSFMSLMRTLNYLMMYLILIMVAFCLYPKLTLKMVDLSQMMSLLLFSIHPDFYQHQQHLATLRVDTFYTVVPRFTHKISSHTVSDAMGNVHLNYDSQNPDPRFKQQTLSSNMLINSAQLLIFYSIFLACYVYLQRSTSKKGILVALRQNFRFNALFAVFFLTVQEEFMYAVLQFQNIQFENLLGIIGFSLAAVASLHIAITLRYMLNNFGPSKNPKAECTYGIIYLQCPHLERAYNRFYYFIVLGIKFALVLFVTLVQTDDILQYGFLAAFAIYFLHDISQLLVCWKRLSKRQQWQMLIPSLIMAYAAATAVAVAFTIHKSTTLRKEGFAHGIKG